MCFMNIPQYQHLLNQFDARYDVWLIGRAEQRGQYDYGQFTLDDPAYCGPLAGVVAALKMAQRHRLTQVAILACDQPLVNEEMLVYLFDQGGKAGTIAYRTIQHIEPFPSIWHTNALTVIQAHQGKYTLQKMLRKCAVYGVEVNNWQHHVNINTLDELAVFKGNQGVVAHE